MLTKLTGCFGVTNFRFSAELKVNIQMFNFLFLADQNFYGCNWSHSWWQARLKYLKSTVGCIIGKKGNSCHSPIIQHHNYIERKISADFMCHSQIKALHGKWHHCFLSDVHYSFGFSIGFHFLLLGSLLNLEFVQVPTQSQCSCRYLRSNKTV